jgi:tetratricopeptide (TPR) repeat protein
MKRLAVIALFMAAGIASAQTGGSEPDIQRRLELIEQGQGESVKAELPTLMATYQNNPGVLYLHGVLTSDGSEAAKIYQSIVDNFPRNEWADDALYRLYQYYYSIGLYKTADQKIAQLKEFYPFSSYASEDAAALEKKAAQEEKLVAGEKKQSEMKPAAEEKTIPEEKPSPVRPKGGAKNIASIFTIQVGVFSTFQNAEGLRKKFEKEGYVANISTQINGDRKLHKVLVGEFKTSKEARRFSAEVKKKFALTSIVVTR